MLTDDDLTHQLRGVFRDSTDDLTYTGRVPTPGRSATSIGVPLASTAAVALALAVVWASSPDTEYVPAPGPDGSAAAVAPTTTAPTTTTQTTTAPTPELVTDTIEVAGFTFRYQREPGQPVDEVIHVFLPGGLPDGVRPVDVPAPAKAWVGEDPRSGEVAIYLKAPDRFNGQLFAVSSPGLDEDQMITALRTGI